MIAGAARRGAPTAAGVALLGSLGLALIPGRPAVIVIALAAAGAAALLALAAPPAVALVKHHLGLLALAALVILAIVWVVVGVERARTEFRPLPYMVSLPGGFPPAFAYRLFPATSVAWPWRIGRISLLPALLALLSAGGGFVLIADAVRVHLGLARAPRTPWRALTASGPRGGRIASRVIPGVALIVVATLLAIGLAGRYVAGHAVLQTFVMLAIAAWAALLVGAPVAVGAAMRVDLDKAGQAREHERLRFAAHLHDSVLQTLALIQRQSHDPDAVNRLARRQEHALRAWMAGETELTSETVAGAVRDAVAEVEDEEGITVELTSIGDHSLDAKGEALVAAAREALRNAARHAPGAAVFAFLDVSRERAELFIRDEGPGFDPESVAAERRGLRDAVIGRMAVAGGQATVDSAVGHGTEVALRIPYNGHGR